MLITCLAWKSIPTAAVISLFLNVQYTRHHFWDPPSPKVKKLARVLRQKQGHHLLPRISIACLASLGEFVLCSVSELALEPRAGVEKVMSRKMPRRTSLLKHSALSLPTPALPRLQAKVLIVQQVQLPLHTGAVQMKRAKWEFIEKQKSDPAEAGMLPPVSSLSASPAVSLHNMTFRLPGRFSILRLCFLTPPPFSGEVPFIFSGFVSPFFFLLSQCSVT